ncbi:hypothetical protein SAMN05216178_6998 [Pseudomonas saponiphila]|uniref:Uncharacterized protein n=1 Tax=Pseudomonas saponiphila TaxID=556534 RepID=A0A1H5A5Z3_9PSED|nr:hypothetical protein [Pseudomonas saponiphila]SED37667.1 hypothetical protein SAMN05216178_6998 [Pseudomonas saponiphila]
MSQTATTARNAFRNHEIPGLCQRSINSTTKAIDGSYVSYNPSSRDYGCHTTALVLGGRVFLILNGDHREGLFGAVVEGGIAAGAAYFIERIAQANSRSEHHEITGQCADIFELTPTAVRCIGQELVDRMTQAANAIRD